MKTLRIAASAGVLAMALAATSLQAANQTNQAATPQEAEASIPFLNQRAIIDWQADGNSGLWVQDRSRQWYYAKLNTYCVGLDFAIRLAFQTHTSNTLDRFSSVIVPNEAFGMPCALSSLVRSDPPEGKTASARRTPSGPR